MNVITVELFFGFFVNRHIASCVLVCPGLVIIRERYFHSRWSGKNSKRNLTLKLAKPERCIVCSYAPLVVVSLVVINRNIFSYTFAVFIYIIGIIIIILFVINDFTGISNIVAVFKVKRNCVALFKNTRNIVTEILVFVFVNMVISVDSLAKNCCVFICKSQFNATRNFQNNKFKLLFNSGNVN